MLTAILATITAGLGGALVAAYYRIKYADQRATIVGQSKDIESLRRDVSDRDAAINKAHDDLISVQRTSTEEIARRDQLIHTRDEEVRKLNAALKVLRKTDPTLAAVALGGLFPPAEANGDGDKGGGEAGGGARRP